MIDTSFNTNSFNTNNCIYRLPCGYCEKLGRDCPKMSWTTPIPAWTITNTTFANDTTTTEQVGINNDDTRIICK